MTGDDLRENLRKAIMLLDCATPHFERAARREEREYAERGGLRQITHQQRAETVRQFIAEIGPQVGYEP